MDAMDAEADGKARLGRAGESHPGATGGSVGVLGGSVGLSIGASIGMDVRGTSINLDVHGTSINENGELDEDEMAFHEVQMTMVRDPVTNKQVRGMVGRSSMEGWACWAGPRIGVL